MSACPWCGGKGEVRVHVYGVREGEGFSEWRWMLCGPCGGMGTASERQESRLRAGRAMAEDRKRRGLTQAEEAKRLGITPAALSRREWGRE